MHHYKLQDVQKQRSVKEKHSRFRYAVAMYFITAFSSDPTDLSGVAELLIYNYLYIAYGEKRKCFCFNRLILYIGKGGECGDEAS